MSIIHDALKKVQQSLDQKKAQTPPVTPPPVAAEPTPAAQAPAPEQTPAPSPEAQPQAAPQQPYTSPFDEPPKPKIEDISTGHKATSKAEQPTGGSSKILIGVGIAVVLITASLWFAGTQLTTMFPALKDRLTALSGKAKQAANHVTNPINPKPLAQVTVNPPPAATTPATPDASTTTATTAAAPAAEPIPLTLKISGIMASGDHNIALVNDKIYQEGETIEGVQIIKINLDSIVVLNNGQEQTIEVRH